MIEQPGRLLDELGQLAVLPESYQALMSVLDDPTANASRIAGVVQMDPALATGLLSLANSAAASPACPVDTVARACLVVGFSKLRAMALGISVLRMFKAVPEHLLDMRSFWEHSVAVAILSREMAVRRRMPHVDAWFLAGLLHDVGNLALCVARPRLVRRILIEAENGDRPVEEVERALLGVDHAELGADLMQRWGLAEWQVAVVRHHHRPSGARRGAEREGASLVHVADVVVSALQIGNAGERSAHTLDPAAWKALVLSEEAMEQLVEGLDDQLDQLTQVLFSGR